MKNSTKILILTLTSFVVGTSQFVIVGILDQVARAVGVSVATAGQLVTIFALANAVGTPLVTLLTARWTAKAQLLASLALTMAGITLMLIAPNIGAMLAARALMGVGTGVFVVTAYSVAAKLASPGKQGSAMANIALGFSVALVLGLPLGRMVTALWNWTVVFWGIGALVVLALVGIALWIRSEKSNSPASPWAQLGYLRSPGILAVLQVNLFMVIGYSVVNTYVVPLLSDLTHSDTQTISLILLGLGLASLAGSKLAGHLCDRLGVSTTLVGGILVQLVALAVLALVPVGAVGAVILLMLWATAAWVCGPTLNINLVQTAPEAASVVLSLNSSFAQLGFALGAAAGGVALQYWPVSSVTGIGAASVATALVIAAIVFRRTLRPRR